MHILIDSKQGVRRVSVVMRIVYAACVNFLIVDDCFALEFTILAMKSRELICISVGNRYIHGLHDGAYVHLYVYLSFSQIQLFVFMVYIVPVYISPD
jgi:predicted membrane protein